MKYFSNEEVRLLDKVECNQGGEWIPATVVFIDSKHQATEEYQWLLSDTPEWAKNCIAIKWDDHKSVIPMFVANAEAVEEADTSILFTDSEDNNELRFLSRSS